jgi:hypothetical protein
MIEPSPETPAGRMPGDHDAAAGSEPRGIASPAKLMSATSRSIPPLVAMVGEFEALGERITVSAMSDILERSS